MVTVRPRRRQADAQECRGVANLRTDAVLATLHRRQAGAEQVGLVCVRALHGTGGRGVRSDGLSGEARFNDPNPVPECLPVWRWERKAGRLAGGMENWWMTSVTHTLGLTGAGAMAAVEDVCTGELQSRGEWIGWCKGVENVGCVECRGGLESGSSGPGVRAGRKGAVPWRPYE